MSVILKCIIKPLTSLHDQYYQNYETYPLLVVLDASATCFQSVRGFARAVRRTENDVINSCPRNRSLTLSWPSGRRWPRPSRTAPLPVHQHAASRYCWFKSIAQYICLKRHEYIACNYSMKRTCAIEMQFSHCGMMLYITSQRSREFTIIDQVGLRLTKTTKMAVKERDYFSSN